MINFPKNKQNRMQGMGDNQEKPELSKVGTVSPIIKEIELLSGFSNRT
jgi:hypothetical protein